ncbi:MltR family transcriptional regulator, partial [Aeromonas veronii]
MEPVELHLVEGPIPYTKTRDFRGRDPKDYRFSDKPIRDLLDRLHGVNQGGMMKLEPPA